MPYTQSGKITSSAILVSKKTKTEYIDEIPNEGWGLALYKRTGEIPAYVLSAVKLPQATTNQQSYEETWNRYDSNGDLERTSKSTHYLSQPSGPEKYWTSSLSSSGLTEWDMSMSFAPKVTTKLPPTVNVPPSSPASSATCASPVVIVKFPPTVRTDFPAWSLPPNEMKPLTSKSPTTSRFSSSPLSSGVSTALQTQSAVHAQLSRPPLSKASEPAMAFEP